MLEKEEIELIKQMSIMTHDLISEDNDTLADIYNLQDALDRVKRIYGIIDPHGIYKRGLIQLDVKHPITFHNSI